MTVGQLTGARCRGQSPLSAGTPRRAADHGGRSHSQRLGHAAGQGGADAAGNRGYRRPQRPRPGCPLSTPHTALLEPPPKAVSSSCYRIKGPPSRPPHPNPPTLTTSSRTVPGITEVSRKVASAGGSAGRTGIRAGQQGVEAQARRKGRARRPVRWRPGTMTSWHCVRNAHPGGSQAAARLPPWQQGPPLVATGWPACWKAPCSLIALISTGSSSGDICRGRGGAGEWGRKGWG